MTRTKYFRVVRKNQDYRLVHTPSGDYVQRHLCDFLSRRDAIACRDRIIAAAPAWDWSDPRFCAEMPTETHSKVWAAIYA
jgi:hypothetical protein